MRHFLIIAAVALTVSGCTSGSLSDAPGLEPIPGSITYGGQPRTRLTKAPVGSSVNHQFTNNLGQRVEERYVIQPDRSLKLVWRRIYRGWPFDDL
ncbi:hypothetical protein [Pseudorhizobium flavum]|uniref:Transmembrane protein n=1 Tax=Pseudorhizobium flavum TaxID=1335061 RepID=A0A7W9YTY6_9HYPH|nr:hypothetical protein [Pseudorhizobium flavum]MBB6178207.1 hypothetical protein [Pseudorhizobium flavum]CAD6614109.1 transmembrane protein [Pseudorhizobium flavum]